MIPFAIKQRGVELEKRVEALEQEQTNGSARNDSEYFFKHHIKLPVWSTGTKEEGAYSGYLDFEEVLMDTDETYNGVGSAQWLYIMMTHIIDFRGGYYKYIDEESGVEMSVPTCFVDFDGIFTPNGIKDNDRVQVTLCNIITGLMEAAVEIEPGSDYAVQLWVGESDGEHLVTDAIVNEGE